MSSTFSILFQKGMRIEENMLIENRLKFLKLIRAHEMTPRPDDVIKWFFASKSAQEADP